MLAAPVDKEPLLLYVAANSRAVSVAILMERKEEGMEYPVQRPVYYISEVLIESKQRYLHWHKLVYGVFLASRKLKHYSQGHPITVVSYAPLGDIIQNRVATGRVAKWAIELRPHGLKYVPRTAIKSQALVDFINDWTELQMPRKRQITCIGLFTLMGPEYWKARGLELFLLPLEVISFVMLSI